jgi:hypothetical protein
MEIRDIPEFCGLYKATSDGQILSFTTKLNGKAMKLNKRKDGYLQVQIKIKQKVHNRLVHVLVDRAFNGEINSQHEINHKDGNKLNNKFENLERVTRQENVRHAIKIGLWNPCRGEAHRSAKLTEEKIIQIKEEATACKVNRRYKYGFIKETANKFNVNVSTIKRILNNETWRKERVKL